MDTKRESPSPEIVTKPRVDAHRLQLTSPQLHSEISFLLNHGVSLELLIAVERRACELGQSPAHILLSNRLVDESRYYSLMAAELGLAFCQRLPASEKTLSRLPGPDDWSRMARLAVDSPICQQTGLNLAPPKYSLAPNGQQFSGLRALLRRRPDFANRLQLTTCSEGLDHLIQRARPTLLNQAKSRLLRQLPWLSAQRVVTTPQAVVFLLLAQLLLVSLILDHEMLLLALHLPAAAIYLSQAGLRYLGWTGFRKPKMRPANLRVPDAELPVYSVLIALYKEANQVDGLLSALAQMDWPKERLEILLICESDDLETIEACRAAKHRHNVPILAILSVPAGQPRTKPKALNYALPLCTGEYLVIYDAEDRPHPGQMREACSTFRRGPPELACLQSPLSISNSDQGWLPTMFAIEYSAHFDGFLPILDRLNLPLPLGGSSNHFKRQALINIGAWDPYNVTEDADLGMRFSRAGCIAATLNLPTYEEAPGRWKDWLCQRTRWYKGWYQTWLVHMRHPRRLLQELGVANFLAFQLLTLGAAVSVLIHPLVLYLLTVGVIEFVSGTAPWWKYALACLDMFTIIFGVCSWCLLAARTLPIRGLHHLNARLWWVPLYWFLFSIAAWRALWQLFVQPHKWEKTPHGVPAAPSAGKLQS